MPPNPEAAARQTASPPARRGRRRRGRRRHGHAGQQPEKSLTLWDERRGGCRDAPEMVPLGWHAKGRRRVRIPSGAYPRGFTPTSHPPRLGEGDPATGHGQTAGLMMVSGRRPAPVWRARRGLPRRSVGRGWPLKNLCLSFLELTIESWWAGTLVVVDSRPNHERQVARSS